jgi:hypothetical protein
MRPLSDTGDTGAPWPSSHPGPRTLPRGDADARSAIIRRGTTHAAWVLERRVAAILRAPAIAVVVLEENLATPDGPIHAIVENADDLPAPDTGQFAALRQLDPPIDAITYASGFALPRTAHRKKRHQNSRRLLAGGRLPVVFTARHSEGRASWEQQ